MYKKKQPIEMKPYQFFRLLVFVCLFAIVSISVLYWLDIITGKVFAVLNAVVAITAAFLGIFARKPVGKEDMSLAVEKVILNYDSETFQKLRKAKEEEQEIRDFIENRSNEILLLKLRRYLIEEIELKYRSSDLAKLIADLEEIESKLDSMKVTYEEAKLPERFRGFLLELNQQEKLEIYLDLFDYIFPFFPFKRLIKTYIKFSYL